MIIKVSVIPIVIVALGTNTKGLVKAMEDEDLEIIGGVETNKNDGIVEIGQNTEKIPGDLRRLVVTQTPVKNYPLTLLKNFSKNNNDKNNNRCYRYTLNSFQMLEKQKTGIGYSRNIRDHQYNIIVKIVLRLAGTLSQVKYHHPMLMRKRRKK